MRYKKDQIVFYHDMGMTLECRVLKDESTKEWQKINLCILEIVRGSRLLKDPEIGEIFTAEGLPDNPNVGWKITESF